MVPGYLQAPPPSDAFDGFLWTVFFFLNPPNWRISWASHRTGGEPRDD